MLLDGTLTIRNPKLGNTITGDAGLALNTNRTGITSTVRVAPRVQRRRYDFESLNQTSRNALETFFNTKTVPFRVDATFDDKCGTLTIAEYCIFDNQELEFVKESDNGCSAYSCTLYMIVTNIIGDPICTETRDLLTTENGIVLQTEVA